jgi:hypothetical protein
VTVTFGPPKVFERKDAEGRKTDYEAVSREMMAAIGRLTGRETRAGIAEVARARVDVR